MLCFHAANSVGKEKQFLKAFGEVKDENKYQRKRRDVYWSIDVLGSYIN